MLQTGLMVGLPSLLTSLFLAISYKYKVLVEFMQPIILFSTLAVLLVINTTTVCGEVDTVMRQ